MSINANNNSSAGSDDKGAAVSHQEPPLVAPGRLDPKYLPIGHPDRIGTGLERLAADLGCSVSDAHELLTRNGLIRAKGGAK